MTATQTAIRTYEFSNAIEFTNRYGQPAIGTVISQDGNRLRIDYLGVMRTFALNTWTLLDTPLYPMS